MSEPHPSDAHTEMRLADDVRRQLMDACGLPSLPSLDDRLIADLGIDSLELLELTLTLEERYGISLQEPPDADLPLKTIFTRDDFRVRDLVEAIQTLRARNLTPSPREVIGVGKASAPPPTASIACEPFTQLGGIWHDTEGAGPCDREATTEHGKGAPRVDRRSLGAPPLLDQLGIVSSLRHYRRRSDGMRCIALPETVCTMGSSDPNSDRDSRPTHVVPLSTFILDAEPVSVLAYSRFLNSIRMDDEQVLADWFLLAPVDDRVGFVPLRRVDRQGDDVYWEPCDGVAHWPMILVSWFGANAYSRWANGIDWREYRTLACDGLGRSTLPSEAQWEYAARGPEPRRFPWSSDNPDGNDTPATGMAQVGRHRRGMRYTLPTLPLRPTNERLGVSPFGILHMAGNVWNWCADFYDPRFYESPAARAPNALNHTDTGVRSERGGSWVGTSALAESWYRRGRVPQARGRCLGFRCVTIAS
ncbi:MAG: SUMF1/EgtB/PvdO family nonheme iron enzyme [Phycisphaerae bacterium]|nr:SUMF1/EgtB/PvdO family nonheme iron enzyme [Phycisphaerae bacterium]